MTKIARQEARDALTVRQESLWAGEPSSEDSEYLTKQLLTYIGNKRALLGLIATAVEKVKRRVGMRPLRVLDAFSGSGVVSRFLKAHSSYLVSNDLEEYAAVTGRCYLRNHSDVDLRRLRDTVAELNSVVDTVDYPTGFIEELYAPRNENQIIESDRVFYTQANARRLDNFRRLIEEVGIGERDLLLGPLLSRASIHANTAGVFKGFYKDKSTGIGRFGGSGADALSRITSPICLDAPILSRFECECEVVQADANDTVRRYKNLDLVYIDPPYNQHPYGSNYFMLNLLVRYQRPEVVSRVSGIPTDWQRSGYNVRSQSLTLLKDLLGACDSRFLLVSFNDEGFVSPSQLNDALSELGRVDVVEMKYNAFRGSRNLRQRDIHVTEQLFLVERD